MAKRAKTAATKTGARRQQKWLVLGGTKEASDFITYWQKAGSVHLILSLAGVTSSRPVAKCDIRIGGFSHLSEDGQMIDGPSGMASYLLQEGCGAVIDLTHPFAQQISANARQAAQRAGIPYFHYMRAPWAPMEHDDWQFHDSWQQLYQTVKTRHLFVAGGQEALNALPPTYQGAVTARMIEEPAKAQESLPRHVEIILSRPPLSVEEEVALFEKSRITAVAAKLSGGKLSAAKLAAARHLSLPVHLVRRPVYPSGFYEKMSALHDSLHRHLRAID